VRKLKREEVKQLACDQTVISGRVGFGQGCEHPLFCCTSSQLLKHWLALALGVLPFLPLKKEKKRKNLGNFRQSSLPPICSLHLTFYGKTPF
jgi:hypothetical protein